jgi:hypothetical protein
VTQNQAYCSKDRNIGYFFCTKYKLYHLEDIEKMQAIGPAGIDKRYLPQIEKFELKRHRFSYIRLL